MSYIYIFGTILFTVYGQLIIKHQVAKYGALPEDMFEKLKFVFNLFLNPFIISGFLSALIASMFWMAAMTKLQLSHAYPFMSLSFVFVFFLSIWLFGEAFTPGKLIGLILIVLGLIVSTNY
jgi:multidrug transporter EmrE-like cation transporter